MKLIWKGLLVGGRKGSAQVIICMCVWDGWVDLKQHMTGTGIGIFSTHFGITYLCCIYLY